MRDRRFGLVEPNRNGSTMNGALRNGWAWDQMCQG
jgi:hypothetical protein